MLITPTALYSADRAFTRARRSRRRAALARLLHRERAPRLELFDERTLANAHPQPGSRVREIPIDAIRGTVEPGKLRMFDRCFRPASATRTRWQRLWLAEYRGQPLPPVELVAVDDFYVVRDGHHRVSVARARGALEIDAVVEAAWLSDSRTGAAA
jgi:hypothetical protein